ncbi:MAG: DegV family protein [Ruminococcus sp.]|nr:DegV family protein [Ruminococcus sp.]
MSGGFSLENTKPYKLYSDSTCDLSKEILNKMEVTLLQLQFEVDGKKYTAEEMSMPEFYGKMRADAVTKTAQIPPSVYEQAFEEDIKNGYDILYLAFSSGLSGSYASSVIARDSLTEKYPEAKIICVDSLCASTGEGLLLYYADEKKRAGMGIDELTSWLEENKLHLCHVFTVDDLKYLHRGGRVSKTAAVAGSILGIKPVLHVDNEGHLIPLAKVRGRKQSINRLADMIKERVGGYENPTVAICHGDCIEDAEYAARLMKGIFGKGTKVLMCYTGPVIGSHSGPGTLALFFMGDHR